jgi:hypothetical protein
MQVWGLLIILNHISFFNLTKQIADYYDNSSKEEKKR